MNAANSQATSIPNHRKAGEPWSESEEEQLVDELRDGLTLEDIAEEHGRSVGAIRSRAAAMLSPDEAASSSFTRVERLRELLAEDDYDWRTPLRMAKSATAWTEDEDEQLRAGWEAGTQMIEIRETLKRSEPMMVRRLIQLGLAKDLQQVVDRLGCDPDGAIALRLAVAQGMGPPVYVLIGLNKEDAMVHLSVHESEQASKALSDSVDQVDGGVHSWLTICKDVGGSGYADPHTGHQVKAPTP